MSVSRKLKVFGGLSVLCFFGAVGLYFWGLVAESDRRASRRDADARLAEERVLELEREVNELKGGDLRDRPDPELQPLRQELERAKQTKLAAEAEAARLRIELSALKSAAVPRSPEVKPVGTTFQDCAMCPVMVVMPKGQFSMGSPATEEMRENGEWESRPVSISYTFAVGKFAVTFDEWDACVAQGGCEGYRPPDEGWGRGRRPVINVSWSDAKRYVSWLSGKANKPYRLLSDSEREYVTRAGTTTPFWFGSRISTGQANYDGNLIYVAGTEGEYREETVNVDSFKPNPWGLYQVHGNVWEWVEDCWNSSFEDAPKDGSAWLAGTCSLRVRRGGSWRNHPKYLRSAVRGPTDTETRKNFFGFRIALTISQ